MHATILAYMFTLVEEDKIATPLFDPTKVQAASNMDYIQKYVAELLKQAFPHLQEYVGSCRETSILAQGSPRSSVVVVRLMESAIITLGYLSLVERNFFSQTNGTMLHERY